MHKKLNSIYLITSLDGLVNSLVGIFIPVYLLTVGYDLQQVMLLFLYYAVFVFVGFCLTALLSQRIGLKKLLILRLPVFILYLYVLYNMQSPDISLVWIALLGTVNVSFFWYPMHIWFARHSDGKNTGSNVGSLFAWPQVSALVAPIVGGVIATGFGFKALFGLSMLIEVLTVIPLMYLPEHFPKVSFDFIRLKQLVKKYPQYIRLELGENIREELDGIIWPIFVYLTLKNIMSVGAIASLMAVGGIMFTFIMGRFTDKISKHKLINYGLFLTLIVWAVRIFSKDPSFIYYSTLIAGLAGILILIPLNTMVYRFAKEEKPEEFIIFRELPISIGRIVVYGLAVFMTANIRYSFALILLPTVLLFNKSRYNNT